MRGLRHEGTHISPDPVTDRLREALDRLRPRLNRLFAAYHVGPEDAEELLQDVLLSTLVKLRSAEIRSLDAWILTVLRNQCFMLRRRETTARRSLEEMAAWKASRAEFPPEVDPDLSLTLKHSLAALPRKQGLVVRLRLEGHADHEVAQRTGYSEASVRKIFSRAVRRLSGILTGAQP